MTQEERIAQAKSDIVCLRNALVFESNRLDLAKKEYCQKKKKYSERIVYLENLITEAPHD